MPTTNEHERCAECGAMVFSKEGEVARTVFGDAHYCDPFWEVYEVLNREPEDAGRFRGLNADLAIEKFADEWYADEPGNIQTPMHVKARKLGEEDWKDYTVVGDWSIDWSVNKGEPA